jgi:hypothetical protein
MTIGFSKNWSHYSWNTSDRVDLEIEQHLILEMIWNCDSEMVRMYAYNPNEFGVYVRTGLHSSRSESRDHIQVILGSNDPESWKASQSNAGYTAHIIYHNPQGNPTKKYETVLFDGQHHLQRVSRN